MKLTIMKMCNIHGRQRKPGQELDCQAEGLDQASAQVLIDSGMAQPAESGRATDAKGRATGTKQADKETR